MKYFDFFEIVFHFKIFFNYIKFIMKRLFAKHKIIFFSTSLFVKISDSFQVGQWI